MYRLTLPAVLLLALGLLQGCGNKGPLYLPQADQQQAPRDEPTDKEHE